MRSEQVVIEILFCVGTRLKEENRPNLHIVYAQNLIQNRVSLFDDCGAGSYSHALGTLKSPFNSAFLDAAFRLLECVETHDLKV